MSIVAVSLLILWDTYQVAKRPILPPEATLASSAIPSGRIDPDAEKAANEARAKAEADAKQRGEAVVKASTEAYGRQKDLLLLALALLGTVTGYYLGRVPAELRAQQGQQAATRAQEQASEASKAAASSADATKAATEQASQARKQAEAGKSAAFKAHAALAHLGPTSKTLSAGQPSQEQEAIHQALQELEGFLRSA